MTLLPRDPKDQRFFLAALAALALLFAYHQVVRGPRTDETQALRVHLASLETANHTARIIAEQNGGPTLAGRVAGLEDHVRQLEHLVPRKEEVPLLLREISLRARDTRLELTRLKPETEEAGEHYVRRTYELNVQGPYHAIGTFLGQVGALSRIMTPIQLKLLRHGNDQTDQGSPVLNANFRLVTYIVPPAGESPADHVVTTAPSAPTPLPDAQQEIAAALVDSAASVPVEASPKAGEARADSAAGPASGAAGGVK
jgi:Tfp pilus assembly protein PilO